jgi:hypothetical protein
MNKTADSLAPSLSGISCVRHSMSTRSIYAKQDEEGHSGHGGIAVDSQDCLTSS